MCHRLLGHVQASLDEAKLPGSLENHVSLHPCFASAIQSSKISTIPYQTSKKNHFTLTFNVPGLPLVDVHILFVELLRGIITSESFSVSALPVQVFQGSAKGQS